MVLSMEATLSIATASPDAAAALCAALLPDDVGSVTVRTAGSDVIVIVAAPSIPTLRATLEDVLRCAAAALGACPLVLETEDDELSEG